jgi:hypothetical protein
MINGQRAADAAGAGRGDRGAGSVTMATTHPGGIEPARSPGRARHRFPSHVSSQAEDEVEPSASVAVSPSASNRRRAIVPRTGARATAGGRPSTSPNTIVAGPTATSRVPDEEQPEERGVEHALPDVRSPPCDPGAHRIPPDASPLAIESDDSGRHERQAPPPAEVDQHVGERRETHVGTRQEDRGTERSASEPRERHHVVERLQDHHRVPVAVEAVAEAHGFGVGRQDAIAPCERGDQHQER